MNNDIKHDCTEQSDCLLCGGELNSEGDCPCTCHPYNETIK